MTAKQPEEELMAFLTGKKSPTAAAPQAPEATPLPSSHVEAQAALQPDTPGSAGASQDEPQCEHQPPMSQSPLPEAPRAQAAEPVPAGFLAHFVLFDIGGQSQKIRELPRYFSLKQRRTLVGRHAKSQIHLDDPTSIWTKHAQVLFEGTDDNGHFLIQPLGEAPIAVNQNQIGPDGQELHTGDLVAIGTAQLIFFQKKL